MKFMVQPMPPLFPDYEPLSVSGSACREQAETENPSAIQAPITLIGSDVQHLVADLNRYRAALAEIAVPSSWPISELRKIAMEALKHEHWAD